MLGKWRLMRNMQKFAVFALALPLCLAMPSVAFANTILTSKTYVDTNMVAINQGVGNSGKAMIVNDQGNLAPADINALPNGSANQVLQYTNNAWTATTMDSTPTTSSQKPVTSGGVKNYAIQQPASASEGQVLTYGTGATASSRPVAGYVKVPVATGAPSSNTPSAFAEIWIQ